MFALASYKDIKTMCKSILLHFYANIKNFNHDKISCFLAFSRGKKYQFGTRQLKYQVKI